MERLCVLYVSQYIMAQSGKAATFFFNRIDVSMLYFREDAGWTSHLNFTMYSQYDAMRDVVVTSSQNIY